MIERLEQLGGPRTRVAVLHLQGPIMLEDGGGRGPVIAARKVVPLLQSLRENDHVAAVVLHIDSPGGSVLASDLIWREVAQLRRQKTVVASFEDTAASGGFYIAAPAQEIVVRPGTVTGSIGVFGGKLVMAEGLRKAGVHSREVLGAANANLYSPSRRFTDKQRDRFRASLERFYDGFVKRVAEGRERPEEDVELHCRGRVWTGRRRTRGEARRPRGRSRPGGGPGPCPRGAHAGDLRAPRHQRLPATTRGPTPAGGHAAPELAARAHRARATVPAGHLGLGADPAVAPGSTARDAPLRSCGAHGALASP